MNRSDSTKRKHCYAKKMKTIALFRTQNLILYERPFLFWSRDNKMEDERLVKHVVLDSGAFLRNAPIQVTVFACGQ